MLKKLPKTLKEKPLQNNRAIPRKLTAAPVALREWIEFANMGVGQIPVPHGGQEFVELLDARFPRAQFPTFRERLDREADGLRGLSVPLPGLGRGVPVGNDAERRFLFYMHTLQDRLSEAQILRAIAGRKSFPWDSLSELSWELLKVCQNCNKVFWANRRDKLTCSATCAVNRRNREWRKHKAEYAESKKKRRSKR
jgi:hypothetical protein